MDANIELHRHAITQISSVLAMHNFNTTIVERGISG